MDGRLTKLGRTGPNHDVSILRRCVSDRIMQLLDGFRKRRLKEPAHVVHVAEVTHQITTTYRHRTPVTNLPPVFFIRRWISTVIIFL